MSTVTTRDGLQVTLQPCPSWCTTDHFDPGTYPHLEDGFHHLSEPVDILTTDVSKIPDGEPTTVQLRLKAFVAPLNAAPGPTQVELALLDNEDAVELTPQLARSIAAALHDLSERAER
ncbi:hypothetical protein AB0C84_42910 [Actinomadura sp. NPDC048955]|uniref:DUF6907 domain-containing protein n=1 Tax=Actinomadura sp. NPDC048955 TaxID=3158228 RepID=UPI003409AC14